MYAIIETGGKQYKVAEGERLSVEKLDAPEGAEVRLDKVVALVRDGSTVFGAPYIEGASVSAEVVGAGKADTVLVYKQKMRKGMRRLRGHRQPYTLLKIKEIKG